jgi:hypothetical protein
MPIGRMLARRLVLVVPLLFVILLGTFMLVRLSGQDPVGLLAGPTATAAEIELVRASLALDQPIWVQFGVYLGKVVRVMPGMQAAFVDIGLEKAGFVHAADIMVRGPDGFELVPQPGGTIESLLREGQIQMAMVALTLWRIFRHPALAR